MRIYKFDFLKVWCMFLVVIVHTLNNSYGNVGQEMIRFFCLCYTMPMFAFISGWFSKEKTDIKKNINHLLIPCIVMTIVNDIIMHLVNPHYQLNILVPGFAMWYLWALFVYRTILPYVTRIPHVILLSFILSWIVGFFPQINVNFSASRIMCFFPYFILGHIIAHDTKREWLKENIMKPINVYRGGVILIAVFLVSFCFIEKYPGYTLATGFNSGFGLSYKGLFLRIALQFIILCTGYIVIRMAPNNKTRISDFGDRTMNVYLLHSLIVLPFAFIVFPPFGEASVMQKISMIAIPTSICMLFFSKPVDRFMRALFK